MTDNPVSPSERLRAAARYAMVGPLNNRHMEVVPDGDYILLAVALDALAESVPVEPPRSLEPLRGFVAINDSSDDGGSETWTYDRNGPYLRWRDVAASVEAVGLGALANPPDEVRTVAERMYGWEMAKRALAAALGTDK